MGDERRSGRGDRDAAYVRDIVDSCRALESYLKGKSLADFRTDLLLQDAVARRLYLIGEAANSVEQSVPILRSTLEQHPINEE